MGKYKRRHYFENEMRSAVFEEKPVARNVTRKLQWPCVAKREGGETVL